MKGVDLGEPTTFLDHVFFWLYSARMSNKQGYCRHSQKYVRFQDFCWDHGKRTVSGKSDANISSWSYDIEGHAKKCVERYCEQANKTTKHIFKVATPCLDDHQFKEEDGFCWRIVYSLLTDRSQMSFCWLVLVDLILSLPSIVSTSSSSVNHPIASKSPGTLKASTGKLDARARRNQNPTQRRVLKEG